MTVLTMRLLGAPEVCTNGEPIRFRSRKEFALLIYLAVEEQRQARDTLITLLWPESDRHHGRVVLRSTLSTLRKRLAAVGDVILAEAAQTLSGWLHRESGGIPFYLTELLQMFERQGKLVPVEAEGKALYDLSGIVAQIEAGQGIPLPPVIRALLLARLAPLNEQARSLLAAAAVLGQFTSFEGLCEMAHLGELDGLTALEQLLKERLLLENGPRAKPYIFAHDKIREIVYTEIGEARRRFYHRQALTLLEADHAPAAVLCYHAQSAQLAAAAFRHALVAGQDALALYAITDAQAHFATAAALLQETETTAAERTLLCTTDGRTLEWSNEFAAALEHDQAMRQLAQTIADPALELAALVGEGTIRTIPHAHCDYAQAESLGQLALTLAKRLADPVSEAKIQWNLLNVYRRTDRPDLALVAGQQSLALAETHNLREQLAYTLHDLANVYHLKGDYPRMFDYCLRAMALWREFNNRPMYIDSANIYSAHKATIGQADEALAVAEETLAMSRALENRWSEAVSVYNFASAALAAAKESMRLSQAIDFTSFIVLIELMAARSYLAVGAIDQAAAAGAHAEKLARAQIHFLLASSAGAFALVKLAQGDLEGAQALLRDLPLNFDHIALPFGGIAETAVVAAALQREDFAAVLSLSQRLVHSAEQLQLTLFTPDLYYLQAQALLGLKRSAEARPVLQRGLALLRRHQQRWHFIPIAGLLADLEEEAGNQAAATALRSEARTVLDEILAHIPQGELQMSFRALPDVRRLLAV